MKKVSTTIVLTVVTLVFGLTVSMAATQHGKRTPATTPASTTETKVMTPESMSDHFIKAREALVKQDYRESASQIRKVEEYLNDEATRAQGQTKKDLVYAAGELGELADRVQAGKVKSEKEMDKDFARAHYAVARYHREKAAMYFNKKEHENAGRELKLSAAHLDRAMKMMGRESKTTVVKDSDDLGDRMAAGAKWTEDEVRKAFTNMDLELDEMGKDLQK